MESSSRPKYHLIVDYIKGHIRSGRYRAGEILPGERVLASELAVSRPSVKRAIEELEREGILECSPSIGSVVRKPVTGKLLVGYLVPDLQDPFHLELIRELDTLLHKHDGSLLVQQGTDDRRLKGAGITHLVKHHMLFDPSHKERVPTVYTGDVPGKASMIVSDVPSGMRLILAHLRKLGHNAIAYASPFRGRQDALYRCLSEAMAAEGLVIPSEWHFRVDPLDRPSCEKVLRALRKSSRGPTALVCNNDWLAIALSRIAREQGPDIPAELSITGYDDLYVSSLLQVPLTTVRFSRRESARKIMEILLAGRASQRRTEIVETRLIVRESTRQARR